MKKRYLKTMASVLLLFAVLFAVHGCSNDDGSPKDDQKDIEIVVPKEGYKLQLVEATFSQPLSQDEYWGTLGGVDLQLLRTEGKTLLFMVPSNVALGLAQLSIPDLNVTQEFEVKVKTLEQPAAQVLTPFFTNLETISTEITSEETEQAIYLKQAIESFEGYYQSISETEKEEMALLYHVNEDFFNNMMNENVGARGLLNGILTLNKHQMETLFFGGGVAVAIICPEPLEKSLGAIIAIVSWKKSRDSLEKLMDSQLKSVGLQFNSILFNKTANASANSGLFFTTGVEESIELAVNRRNFVAGDVSETTSGLVTFFGSHDIFTSGVTKLNNVITFVNDNIFFSNISTIPVYTMPTEDSLETIVMDGDYFEGLTLSVADNNVQLTVGNLNADGIAKVKLTIKNPDAVQGESVHTSLNYTYEDAFSSISGSVPVEVKLEEDENDFSLAGNWNFVKLTMIGGDFDSFTLNETKTEYYYDCPSLISYISKLTGASVNFTESSFAVNMQFYEKYFGGISIDDCSYTGTPEEGNFYWNINANYSNQSFEENGILHVPVIGGSWSYINSEDEGTTPLTGDYIKIINENKIECHLSVELFEDGEQDDVSIILELTR